MMLDIVVQGVRVGFTSVYTALGWLQQAAL